MTVKCVAKFSWIFSVKINYAHLQMHEEKGNLQSKKKKKNLISWDWECLVDRHPTGRFS